MVPKPDNEYDMHAIGKALPHAALDGRKVYKVPVTVRINDSRLCTTVRTVRTVWLAHTAADAANAVRDLFEHIPEVEVDAYGPKGGRVSRYIGWHSAIGAQLATTARTGREPDLEGDLRYALEVLGDD